MKKPLTSLNLNTQQHNQQASIEHERTPAHREALEGARRQPSPKSRAKIKCTFRPKPRAPQDDAPGHDHRETCQTGNDQQGPKQNVAQEAEEIQDLQREIDNKRLQDLCPLEPNLYLQLTPHLNFPITSNRENAGTKTVNGNNTDDNQSAPGNSRIRRKVKYRFGPYRKSSGVQHHHASRHHDATPPTPE